MEQPHQTVFCFLHPRFCVFLERSLSFIACLSRLHFSVYVGYPYSGGGDGLCVMSQTGPKKRSCGPLS